MMKQRITHTPEMLRAEMTDLAMEEEPIDGRAYTLTTPPHAARDEYQKHTGHAPTRYWIDHHLYIPSHETE